MELTPSSMVTLLKKAFPYRNYKTPTPSLPPTHDNLQPYLDEYKHALYQRELYIHEHILPYLRDEDDDDHYIYIVPQCVYVECDDEDFIKTHLSVTFSFIYDIASSSWKWEDSPENKGLLGAIIPLNALILDDIDIDDHSPTLNRATVDSLFTSDASIASFISTSNTSIMATCVLYFVRINK